MTRKVSATAPSKIILFGEHFVVYGGLAIALPVEKRSTASVKAGHERDEPKLKLKSGEMHATAWPGGRYEGEELMRPLAAVYMHVLSKKKCDESLHAEVSTDRILKGMGGSASVCASFAAALCSYLHTKCTNAEIFDAAQAGEEVAHGGRPSGIDAITVIGGSPQKFSKQFNPLKYVSEPFNAQLPEGTSLLIIDTYKGERDATGDLIARFGASNGIAKKPDELDQGEREKLLMPYEKIVNKATGELKKDGDAEALGKLMNANHELLKSVSTDEIETARQLALSAGALGAKLTGAGGKGGAVLALVKKPDAGKVQASLISAGFPCFEAEIAKSGIRVSES